jgi:hypothetical protein
LKARWLFLAALAVVPAMLEGQIVLYSLNGIAPSPLGSVYGYGQVAAGDSMIVRFRALNTGSASVTITCLSVKNTAGAGFSIVNSSSTPFVVAAGQPMDFFVGFSATAITSYAATVEVGTGTATDACGGTIESAILLATVVPAPILSVAAPCTGPDANKNISFGRITQGTQEACTFSIQNPFPQDLTVSPLLVTGAAFTTTSANAVTIAAGQSTSFTILFSPATGSAFTGTLTVGTRTYSLAGTGFSPPLSSLVWNFDSTKIGSGEQHTLSLQLSAPATVSAAGTMTLTFSPSIKTVADDSAVQFVATSTRTASFAVSSGAAAIMLNAQPNIVFSTGTTAGTITFTVDSGIYGLSGSPSTSVTTAPAAVVLASSAATSRANELDVVISGFDNTYSIGGMSFAFVDRNGGAIATVPGDFSSDFQTFFKAQNGSSFLMRASFPVTGDVSQVGGVTVMLNNSAGVVTTPSLKFP